MKARLTKLEKDYKVLEQHLDRTNVQAITLLGENDYLKSVNSRLEQENKELKEMIEKLLKGNK